MSIHTVLVAAGKGRRFGELKQFYSYNDRPLFLYALDNFETNKNIKKITVVVPINSIKYVTKTIKEWRFKKVYNIIAGGKRRQDSVLNALNTIKTNSGIVIIHDGVRPIASEKLINKGIKLCRKYKAVIFGSKVSDTVKEVKSNVVIKTLFRENLYFIQTPQFFTINLLKNAYKKADLSVDYTDEAAILESLEIPVYLFQGDRFNIKITRRSDLKILSKIL
ncbi:MAG: 2-C-methyl-D-erythritol 4-phosphate cytidylyltransferase [Candidatus Stahlbacteria bacterium]|jgi:2-C-methyl-D-erythritol 4-phosphate cytidylyltransferase|nr:MAG: 2-C-methyl-D-erythritol 4-phosphate cytidylyltransferase [Candidatus Stahlbacteria bacterium]